MTKEERSLWYDFLRTYPVRFMRQRPIGQYIVDFYCAKARLVVELDGSRHFDTEGRQKDAERDRALSALGISVLRFPNTEVMRNFAGVCEQIDQEVRRRSARGSPCEGEHHRARGPAAQRWARVPCFTATGRD